MSARIPEVVKNLETAYWRNFVSMQVVILQTERSRTVTAEKARLKRLMIIQDTQIKTNSALLGDPQDYHVNDHFDVLDDENLTGISRDSFNSTLALQEAVIPADNSLANLQMIQSYPDILSKPVVGPGGNVISNAKKKKTVYDQLQGINDHVGKYKTDIENAQKSITGTVEGITNIKTISSDLKLTNDILEKFAALPRELIPYQLVSEIRNTICLFQTILSFPQLFENAIRNAYNEFINLLRDSGCATTLRRL
jgi:hypothetical protein